MMAADIYAGPEVPEAINEAPDGAPVRKGELLAAARSLERRGYTVIASRGKEPAHRWKYADEGRTVPLDREGANRRALAAVSDGRATSLSVRLDGDLAALDLDFLTPGLTVCFVDEWRRRVDPDPVMVTGRKGGKIFVRLEGKEDVGTDLVLDPVPGFCGWTGPDGMRNMLELKRSLSAVYGQHSEGIRYRRYEGFAGLHETYPDDLPVVRANEVTEVYRASIERLVPFGTLSDRNVDVARICAAAVHRGDLTVWQLAQALWTWGYDDVLGLFGRHGDRSLGKMWDDPVVRSLAGAGREEFAEAANQALARVLAIIGSPPEGTSIFETVGTQGHRHDTEPTFTDTGETS